MKIHRMQKAFIAFMTFLFSMQISYAHDLWVISTKDDNFAEYEIPSDPNDKSNLEKFIKYQKTALVSLEQAAAEYLSILGLEYKVSRKFEHLGILALEIIDPEYSDSDEDSNDGNNEDNNDNSVNTILNKAKTITPPPFHIYKNRKLSLNFIKHENDSYMQKNKSRFKFSEQI
mgnify:FL=1